MIESTAQIRQRMRAERARLHHEDVTAASLLIADRLCKIPAVCRATSIAVYLAAFNEVDCTLFAQRMSARGKTLYVPILRKNHLLFAPDEEGREYRLNRFGIAEPVCKTAEIRTARQLDIIVTPLVAFDKRCNRIGMGGGYYDRTLAIRKRRNHWRKPLTVGVAYSFQETDAITPAHWDVPLDVVITEKESYGSY